MKNKEPFIALNNTIILFNSSLSFLFLFLPVINIKYFDVYQYDLTKTLFQNNGLSITDLLSNGHEFGRSLFFAVDIIVLLIQFFSSLFYKENQKKVFKLIRFISFWIVFFVFCFGIQFYCRSFSIKSFAYFSDISSRFPQFKTVFVDTNLHKGAYQITLGIGSFLTMVFAGLNVLLSTISFFCFCESDQKEVFLVRTTNNK